MDLDKISLFPGKIVAKEVFHLLSQNMTGWISLFAIFKVVKKKNYLWSWWLLSGMRIRAFSLVQWARPCVGHAEAWRRCPIQSVTKEWDSLGEMETRAESRSQATQRCLVHRARLRM